MAKHKKKSPSRMKYEQANPTISFRADKQTKELLREHLEATGHSAADFIKDALGREKSMVKERLEILVSKQMATLEDRLRCLEDLALQTYSLAIDTSEFPPLCPRCENQEMRKCEGREIETSIGDPWGPTWKCPKCGYFLNTYKRIDPESIRWI